MKAKTHRPFHIYIGHTYFVSGRCLYGVKHFNSDKKKLIFQNVLARLTLDNHYHLLFLLERHEKLQGLTNVSSSCDKREFVTNDKEDARCEKLASFIRRLHSITSKELNQLDNTPGRRVWHQYWDYCIRNKSDFWFHFNYIIQNPLKHGLVRNLEQAYHYKFSSNPIWLKRFTAEGLSEGFIRFPVKNWTPADCE